MNLALEKCEEYINGVKKRSYGDAFLRGNNGKSLPAYIYIYMCTCAKSFYSDVYSTRIIRHAYEKKTKHRGGNHESLMHHARRWGIPKGPC